MKNHYRLLEGIIITLTIITCLNMGETRKESETLQAPRFANLEKGQGKYSGIISDDNSKIDVTDISFSGETKVGGIRTEKDDSSNVLDLSIHKEIIIEKPSYESKKYSDKEFCLATVVSVNGAKITNLLIPKFITICAKEKKTLTEKAWYISKLKKIKINKPKPIEINTEEATEKKGYFKKLFQ